MRQALLWDTAIGFCGFFAAVAVLQAVVNLFRPFPAVWPALLAAALCALAWGLTRAKARALRQNSGAHPRTGTTNPRKEKP